ARRTRLCLERAALRARSRSRRAALRPASLARPRGCLGRSGGRELTAPARPPRLLVRLGRLFRRCPARRGARSSVTAASTAPQPPPPRQRRRPLGGEGRAPPHQTASPPSPLLISHFCKKPGTRGGWGVLRFGVVTPPPVPMSTMAVSRALCPKPAGLLPALA